MKNKLKELVSKKAKGGIESILGVVILVGLVVVLILTIVVPMMESISEQGETTKGQLGQVTDALEGLAPEKQ